MKLEERSRAEEKEAKERAQRIKMRSREWRPPLRSPDYDFDEEYGSFNDEELMYEELAQLEDEIAQNNRATRKMQRLIARLGRDPANEL
jgi:hypothetical protein